MTSSLAKRLLPLLALLAITAAGAVSALAVQPPQDRMYEIRLPEPYPAEKTAAAGLVDAEKGLADLTARYGGNWRVYGYNTRARTPRHVYGSGAPLAAKILGPADLEELARQVIRDNAELLRADERNLVLAAAPHAGGKWVAHFQQTHAGIEVWEGKARVGFTGDGRLILLGSDYYSGIDVDPRPGIPQGEAEAIATGDVPFDPAVDRVEEGTKLLVLPYPVSATEVEHRLVWRLRVRTQDPLAVWVTHVDAHSGEILWRYNDVHMEYLGDTENAVNEETYCNGLTVQPMPYLRVSVSGLTPVYADAGGSWSVPGTGGSRTVTAQLLSPYVDVAYYLGADASYSGTATEDVPHTIVFDGTNARQDELDVFDAVNEIHDFFETFAPGFSYSNALIYAYTGRTDGYCPGNAWWDGTINFCEAGGGYANTGEIQGVVQHEFGHGVQNAIIGWQGNEGLGEGNSDILANLLTQESIIGRGFFEGNCAAGIRDSDNSLIYPDDVVGQSVHNAGRVIAGFNWDALALMQAAYGTETGTVIAATNWHEGRVLLQPTTQPDQVFATFFADDDDGNLDNGTPNHAFYCTAATNHDFDCPEILVGVLFSHAPLEDTVDTTNPYVVQATITSTEAALDPSKVRLVYRTDGGAWTEVVMTGLGGDLYEAQIPAQSPSLVEYYLYAEDAIGTIGTLPALAPDTTYPFLVAWLLDPVEVAGTWSAGAPDDDATTGLWERVDPVGTSAQPDDDHTASGTLCWVTGQHLSGQTDGYNDVDGGKTTLVSPVWDLSSFDEVTIRYWKWYSNNMGNAPSSDWWDVDVSNDGGSTWTSLEHTMTSTGGWESVLFDLPALVAAAPDQVQLRFVAADEGDGSLVEAAIDDLAILATSSISGIEDGDLAVRLVTELDQNYPNPFNPKTEIRFSLKSPGRAVLKVFDTRGRLVRTLVEGRQPAGPRSVVWDGTDHAGKTVPSGVYFYRLEADDTVFAKRMLLIK